MIYELLCVEGLPVCLMIDSAVILQYDLDEIQFLHLASLLAYFCT